MRLSNNIILSLLIFTFLNLKGQIPAYKSMMNDYSINFYTVCDSAEAYFKTQDKGKGSGYAPFQRWKYANESKYYPSGNRMVDHYLPYKEFEKFKKATIQSTKRGVFTNENWKSLGPDSIGQITGSYGPGLGRIEFVEINKKNTKQMYLCSRSGGLWRTDDDGKTWSQKTDFTIATGVDGVTASPNNFDSILLNIKVSNSYTSFGIYRSIDGGKTITSTNFNATNLGFGGLGSDLNIFRVKYHPRVPNLVFVATNKGIFKSTDNLKTWKVLLANKATIWNMEFHPTNDSIIYLYNGYYYGNDKDRILISKDQGNSYYGSSNLASNGNQIISISVSPKCPNCVFAISRNGIWKSIDTGRTFNFLTTTNNNYLGSVNDQDTSNYIVGDVNLYQLNNWGQQYQISSYWHLSPNGLGNYSFNTSTNYTHADLRYITCLNGVFYVCTDGFVSRSNDKGVTWKKLNLNTSIRENYCLGVSQSNYYKTICGSQDNGSSIKTENGWIEFYGADGMEQLIHPFNDNWMISNYQYGNKGLTLDGGLTRQSIQSTAGGGWVAPLLFDPNNHMRIFAFGSNVEKSEDFGLTWETLGKLSSSNTVLNAAIAQNNSQIMVISDYSNIDLSQDGGKTFKKISNNLPNYMINDIAFSPTNDSIIIVVYGGLFYKNQQVYITKNLGKTWTNITHNLGNMQIQSVVIDHSNNANIYIGAVVGIFRKSMKDTVWQLYNKDLPNVSVNELEIVNGSNTLRAATWGRGLWECSLVGRASYPSIIKTKMTSPITNLLPNTNSPQTITSIIKYDFKLKNVYIKWSANDLSFKNTIKMSNSVDSIWVSDTAIPKFNAGTNIYFKVYAIGQNKDTTETYKFMYTIQPYEYCKSKGYLYDSFYISKVKLAGKINNNNEYSDKLYKNPTFNLIAGASYKMEIDVKKYQNEANIIGWIDYNNDRVFDANSEKISSLSKSFGKLSISFTVPQNAILSDTIRLRLKLKYNQYGVDTLNPCANIIWGEVEDHAIVINKSPNLSYSGDSVYCEAENINIDYSGTPLDSVTWKLLDQNQVEHKFKGLKLNTKNLPIGKYDLTLIGFINDVIFSNVYLKAIEIVKKPNVDAGSNQIICKNKSTTLNGTGDGELFWSHGVVNAIPFTPLTSQFYTLKTIDTVYGCTNYDSIFIQLDSVDTRLMKIDNNTLKSFANNAHYQWINCITNELILNDTNQLFTAKTNGNYAVIITNNNCIDTSICMQLNTVGVKTIEKYYFNIFPNPAQNIVEIVSSISETNFEIEISNSLGQIVLSPNSRFKGNAKIDISNFTSGIYTLRIKIQNSSTLFFKLVKE